jgi:glycosyltransferase involved in cell wall biosynthesis
MSSSISVALCTFNGAKYIGAQLESIRDQIRPPDELIVCDDGSSDETVSIVRAFRAPFPIRVVENATTLRSTKNFEKAIGLCTGDLIALADQDDVWEPNKLSRLEGVLGDSPEAGYAFSDAAIVGAGLESRGYTMWQANRFSGKLFREFSGPAQLRTLLRQDCVTGACMVFRASLRERVLPINELWVHDGWIAVVATASGFRGIAVPEPLIRYRQHAAQQIGDKRRTAVGRVAHAMKSGTEELVERSRRLVELERWLTAIELPDRDRARALQMIREKLTHSEVRLRVRRRPGLSRVPLAVSEIWHGGYQRYSKSWRSAVRDVLNYR